MAGEIEAYLRARKAFERVATELEELADEIVEIGESLRDDPTDVAFTNAGTPLDASVSRTFDAEDWKSAKEIQALLVLYHSAMDEMHACWEKVPADLRDGVLPPDTNEWN